MPAKRPVYQTQVRDVAPKVRLAQRTALSRREREELARLNRDVNLAPNEKPLWRTEYILARNLEGKSPEMAGARTSRRFRRSRRRYQRR
jgi:hypothetical protein